VIGWKVLKPLVVAMTESDAGADAAVDDVQLLSGDRWTDEHHRRDALHRYVDGRRDLQIALGDVHSGLRQRGRLLRVTDQDPHGYLSLSE
jgi:hypothetical protein